MGSNVLWLESKCRYGSCLVAGKYCVISCITRVIPECFIHMSTIRCYTNSYIHCFHFEWCLFSQHCYTASDARNRRHIVISIYSKLDVLDRRVVIIWSLYGVSLYCTVSLQWHIQPVVALYGAPRRGGSISLWVPRRRRSKCNDLKCVRKPTKSRLSLTHDANKSSVEQNKR